MSQELARALVRFGSRQWEVTPGAKIQVDLLPHQPESTFDVTEILWVCQGEGSVKIGQPFVPQATVRCRVLRHLRGNKVVIFKKRSKKAWKKKTGFRSELTELLVEDIKVG